MVHDKLMKTHLVDELLILVESIAWPCEDAFTAADALHGAHRHLCMRFSPYTVRSAASMLLAAPNVPGANIRCVAYANGWRIKDPVPHGAYS